MNNSQNSDYKIFQGDWSCSSCHTDIKELPFEPRYTNNLLCQDCHSSQKSQQPDRQTFQGDWKCHSCDGSITQLPFEPRDTSNLLCKDCYRKSKEV